MVRPNHGQHKRTACKQKHGGSVLGHRTNTEGQNCDNAGSVGMRFQVRAAVNCHDVNILTNSTQIDQASSHKHTWNPGHVRSSVVLKKSMKHENQDRPKSRTCTPKNTQLLHNSPERVVCQVRTKQHGLHRAVVLSISQPHGNQPVRSQIFQQVRSLINGGSQ
jgi:hypothetical protein